MRAPSYFPWEGPVYLITVRHYPGVALFRVTTEFALFRVITQLCAWDGTSVARTGHRPCQLKPITAQPCEKTAHQNELLFLCESQEGVHQCWREPPTK